MQNFAGIFVVFGAVLRLMITMNWVLVEDNGFHGLSPIFDTFQFIICNKLYGRPNIKIYFIQDTIKNNKSAI